MLERAKYKKRLIIRTHVFYIISHLLTYLFEENYHAKDSNVNHKCFNECEADHEDGIGRQSLSINGTLIVWDNCFVRLLV